MECCHADSSWHLGADDLSLFFCIASQADANCVKDKLIAKSILGDSIQTDNDNDLTIFSGSPVIVSWHVNNRLWLCNAHYPYPTLYPQYTDVYKVIDLDRQSNNGALDNLN